MLRVPCSAPTCSRARTGSASAANSVGSVQACFRQSASPPTSGDSRPSDNRRNGRRVLRTPGHVLPSPPVGQRPDEARPRRAGFPAELVTVKVFLRRRHPEHDSTEGERIHRARAGILVQHQPGGLRLGQAKRRSRAKPLGQPVRPALVAQRVVLQATDDRERRPAHGVARPGRPATTSSPAVSRSEQSSAPSATVADGVPLDSVCRSPGPNRGRWPLRPAWGCRRRIQVMGTVRP